MEENYIRRCVEIGGCTMTRIHVTRARLVQVILLVFKLICELSERHVHSETFDDPLPRIRLGCWFINCVADYLTSTHLLFYLFIQSVLFWTCLSDQYIYIWMLAHPGPS